MPRLRALAAALLLVVAAALVPLPDPPAFGFHSNYGIADNRRAFLVWGACLAAALLLPLLSGGKPHLGVPSPGPLRRVGWRILVPAGLLTALLFVGPGVAYRAINGHEMVHLGYLNEIEHGRQLNIDTRITYGPLYGYSIHAFMKLAGFSLVGFRLYWHVVTALFVFAVFAVGARYFRSRALLALFAGYLVLFTLARYFLPDARGIHDGLWGWGFLLRQGWAPLAVLLLAPVLGRGGPAWSLWTAGALPVFGYFFTQESGVPAAAALATLALVSRGPAWRMFLRRDVPLLAAGAAAALAGSLVPALVRGAAPEFLAATAHWPALFARGAGNLPFPSPLGGDLPRALPYWILPAAVLVLLAREAWAMLRGGTWSPAVLALLVHAGTSMGSLLVRADPLHLFNVTVAPLTAGFLMLDRALAHPAAGPRARRFRAGVPALLAVPLFVASPSVTDVAAGLAGRVRHPVPAPPQGLVRIDLDRGGIWTPPGAWYQNHILGKSDSAEGMRMIHRLSEGRPTYIVGGKASLHYFLADVPCSVPFTDIPSQAATDDDVRLLNGLLETEAPDFIFVSEEYSSEGQRRGESTPTYRNLGLHHAFYVFQRRDLPPPAEQPGR